MNEELQEQLIKRFTKRFQDYNEKVLKELGKTISQFGKVLPGEVYSLAQQLKYNTTIKDLEKELAKIIGKSIKEIQAILEYIAKENIEFSKPFYEARKLNTPIYEYHGELQRIVNSMAALSANNFVNIARSTGFRLLDINKKPLFLNIEETYHKVIDEAVYAITTGKDSYNQQMREIIKQLANSGVRKIEYESGYTRRIDTAVRMNLMDTFRQVSNETSKQLGKEFGADGVEIGSVQQNPAPDHERCQGRQFSYEEFEKFQNHEKCKDYQDHIYDVHEGGKERRAISEYNCRHNVIQIILGINKPIYSDEELQEIIDNNNKGVEIDGTQYTMYEATQLQRRIETEIRKAKEQNILAQASNDEELTLNSQQRITSLMNKYKQVSKQANMDIQIDRTYVANYKPKKIKEDLPYRDVTKEWLENAKPNSHQVLDRNYFEYENIQYKVDGKNVVLDYSEHEKEIAEWLEDTFGGEIYMLPRINNPSRIETADYLFRKEYWDLKEIYGNGKHTLDSAIKKKKSQANNFIFDLSNSKMTNEEALRQLDLIFNSKDRKWLEKIILKRDKNVIAILKHKKRD